MTEGVVGSRAKVGVWLVTEDRDKAFVGTEDAANPLQEKTTIRVPLLTFDIRLTERLGVQAAATFPM